MMSNPEKGTPTCLTLVGEHSTSVKGGKNLSSPESTGCTWNNLSNFLLVGFLFS